MDRKVVVSLGFVPPSSPVELVHRLQARDPTLWGPADTPELADRLGWVDLPATMASRLEEIKTLAAGVAAEGTEDVVVLGMGGSSLAPEVFASVFGVTFGHPRLTVLDSTHPDQVRRVAAAINPHRAVFVVSSKSGGTLETMSGFRFFWEVTGGQGDRFIAITDPGSSLADLAVERRFRALVLAPTDVGGRFSALTPFGLVPAALIGVDLGRLLAAAGAVDWTAAAEMGIRWGEAALSGRDKLSFLTSPALRAFPSWLEQLVAESLGKDGKGIVPIAEEPILDRFGHDRLFVDYRLEGGPGAELPRGQEIMTRRVADRYGLAGEMMAAEIATVASGHVLGVHPFNQPDVEAAKERARHALDGTATAVDLVDHSSPSLAETLSKHLGTLGQGDYFCVQAFLPSDRTTDAAIAGLRKAVGNRGGNATTSGYGPRFLHSTGQLHKGGPDTGVFLQLVDSHTQDLAIPETTQTFGQVIAAQALGDYLALKDRGRRVLRVDLGPDRGKGMAALVEGLGHSR